MKKFLIIFSILIVSGLLLVVSLLLYIGRMAGQDTKVKSDVILVLGGEAMSGSSCYGPRCEHGSLPHPHVNPCLVARVNHAVSLYKKHYASKILMSGGTDKDTNVNEAETMGKIATASGVPASAIVLENKSHTTYENFAFSQKILTAVGLHSVIIVTDPYHIARSGLIASKLHYQYTVSPDVDSPCWDQDKNNFINRDSVREMLAIISYKLLNKL